MKEKIIKYYIESQMIAVFVAFLYGCNSLSTPTVAQPNSNDSVPNLQEYNQLVWADNFNNQSIDTTKWEHAFSHYWKHDEIQLFSNNCENAFIRDGKLVIKTTEKENAETGRTEYISACITTKNKFQWQYGRIDIKAKMPFGKGLISSLGMQPVQTDSVTGAVNAIEIATVTGNRTNRAMSIVRFNDYQGIQRHKGAWVTIEDEYDLARQFHLYSLIWEHDKLWFYIDGNLTFHVSNRLICPSVYPFNSPCYLNIHTAVGGYWAGMPDSVLTSFPQELEVDYIKIYNKAEKNIESEQSDSCDFPDITAYKKLAWSDEFDQQNISEANWTHETGDYWHNNEIQAYTADTANSYIRNGKLVICAKHTPKHIETIRDYTSARLITKDKVKFGFGRIDFRIKTDHGKGIWPAAWLLPNDNKFGYWPSSGEIDVLEVFGADSVTQNMTAHFGSNRFDHRSRGGKLYRKQAFSDDFHVYTLIREKDHIYWYFDGEPAFQISKALCKPHHYPFNEDFYVVLNLAVGGGTAGYPDKKVLFPKKMMVDYVRYYKK